MYIILWLHTKVRMEAIEASQITDVFDGKGRQEILVDGYFYDVTDFIRKHPGGSVIQFYTEPGEDATQAVEQFHFRSRKKVQAILKSFKKRPARMEEVFPDKKVLTKHEALNKDFKELFEQLLAEGYFEPSIKHVMLRFLEPTALVILSVALALVEGSVFLKLLGPILAGYSFSRFGWVQHEGGHNSLTGYPKVDKLLQDISMSFFMGGSSVWWNSQHNRHHAMPQRLHHDVDLAALPFVAFHEREVTSEKQVNKFFMKYQGFLYWTVDLFLVALAWKFYIHPRCQLRKKAYFEMFLNIFSYGLIFYVGFVWFFAGSYFFAFFFALNFSLNHSHLEVADKPTHWIEYSLTHTADIRPSMMVDYFMGYLNYQIEHHLFPTMPQFRNREVSERVRALAKKHNLPYTEYGYFEAVKLAMTNLHRVGKNVAEKRDWGDVNANRD